MKKELDELVAELSGIVVQQDRSIKMLFKVLNGVTVATRGSLDLLRQDVSDSDKKVILEQLSQSLGLMSETIEVFEGKDD